MALSFQESMKSYIENKVANKASSANSNFIEDPEISQENSPSYVTVQGSIESLPENVTLLSSTDGIDDNREETSSSNGISLLADDEEDPFVLSDEYKQYKNYEDEKFSYVNDMKEITVDSSQVNLTQEENSQYIPFEMPRYYDGIDLMNMLIQIHFVNPSNREWYVLPVDVSYNSTKIRFHWLIDQYVTSREGTVTFEIVLTGKNEKDENYLWRTLPNGKLNIIRSLSGNGDITPSEDWQFKMIEEITNRVLDELEEQVMGELEDRLSNYYTKEEVDDLLDIDIIDAGSATS